MDKEKPKLYRRRYIPDECILLKDDVILHQDDKLIITKWKTLKPRKDFDHGCSCFYLDKGIKISRFFDEEGELLFHYCDVIETHYDPEENAYIFNDLLADVIVYDNGFVKVLDVGEIAEAVDEGIITVAQAMNALRILDELLTLIYKGEFMQLAGVFERYIF